MNITAQEYYFQVQAIARELFEAATVEHGYRSIEDVQENFYENLMDAVNYHDFIIDGGKVALDVLRHSRNHEAYFEQGMGKLTADNFSTATVQMATWAMHEDIAFQFNSLLEDWMEELNDNE